MKFNKITIDTVVSTDIQKAWNFYTQTEHITQWNFAADSWHCPSATNDLQVGGKFSSRMEAKDGSFGFDFEGIYTDLENGKQFTYELEDGRKASVSFKDKGTETNVRIVFDAETENSEELQKGGWQAILDNYKKYTETN